MGVIYLLLYIFGAVLVWVGAGHLFSDVLDGEPLLASMQVAGFGGMMIGMGALLHAVVLRRRGDAGVLEGVQGGSRSWYVLSVAAWLVPTLVAWAQFELFVDPIHMFPVLTVGGAAALVLGVVSQVLGRHSLRWPATIAAVALVGLPAGLLSVSLPLAHFNHHLSAVKVWSFGGSATGDFEEVLFEADDASYVGEMPPLLGEEMGGLLSALANAETIDVGEEIAAGRMRRLEDGTLLRVGEDGEDIALGSWESFSEDMDAALQADRARASLEEEKRRADWEVQVEARRRGGRLFR